MTINVFQPTSITVGNNSAFNPTSIDPGPAGGTTARRERDQLDRFVEENGSSNPPFNTSTSGRLPTDVGASGKIVRGYIRRSRQSGSALAGSQLNFMYNPEVIVRDYVSYMDQAALDPFNTIYDSGNLVNAPNFINFSFKLLFDRQIENANGQMPEGVLVDNQYFDMVVRNVAPASSGSRQVADNGIMMVNPEDITVVFSEQLTVQGRPINAQVKFLKFNHKMIPIRMEVTLTMIITYFGPIAPSYNFDYNQSVGDYKALVPYHEVYSEEFTTVELEEAKRGWEEYRQEAHAASVTFAEYTTQAMGASMAAQGAGGAAGMALPANAEVSQRLVTSLRMRLANNPAYSQAANLRTGTSHYDCSGLVSMCFKDHGLTQLLAGNNSGSNVAGIMQHQISTNFTKMVNVGRPNELTMLGSAQPGDILVRHNMSGRSNHIVMVGGTGPSHIQDGKVWIGHARSTARGCGFDLRSPASLTKDFNYHLRVAAAGNQSAAQTWM